MPATLPVAILKFIGEYELIQTFVKLARLSVLVRELTFGAVGVGGVVALLYLSRTVFASQTDYVLPYGIALIQILIWGSSDSFLVESRRQRPRVLLLFVVTLLYCVLEWNSGALIRDFVVLGFHGSVNLLVLGDICLDVVGSVLEATRWVMDIFGCSVLRLLKALNE